MPDIQDIMDVTFGELSTEQQLQLKEAWRTDTANQRGGSEWEPIKILLDGDGDSNKMNTASNTRLRLTTKVGQAHVATGVPLDLGTNTQPSDPRNAAKNQSSSLQTRTGQTGEHHRSDRSLLMKLSNFH
jgi:hypothetical protein